MGNFNTYLITQNMKFPIKPTTHNFHHPLVAHRPGITITGAPSKIVYP